MVELEVDRMHQERDVIAMQFELKNLTFLMRRPKQRALDLLLLAQLYRLVPGDELYSRSIPTSLALPELQRHQAPQTAEQNTVASGAEYDER